MAPRRLRVRAPAPRREGRLCDRLGVWSSCRHVVGCRPIGPLRARPVSHVPHGGGRAAAPSAGSGAHRLGAASPGREAALPLPRVSEWPGRERALGRRREPQCPRVCALFPHRRQGARLLRLPPRRGAGQHQVRARERRGSEGLLLPGDSRDHGGRGVHRQECRLPVRLQHERLRGRAGHVEDRDQAVRHPRGQEHGLQVARQAPVRAPPHQEGGGAGGRGGRVPAARPAARPGARAEARVGHPDWGLHPPGLRAHRERRRLRRLLLPLPRVTLRCVGPHPEGARASQPRGPLVRVHQRRRGGGGLGTRHGLPPPGPGPRASDCRCGALEVCWRRL